MRKLLFCSFLSLLLIACGKKDNTTSTSDSVTVQTTFISTNQDIQIDSCTSSIDFHPLPNQPEPSCTSSFKVAYFKGANKQAIHKMNDEIFDEIIFTPFAENPDKHEDKWEQIFRSNQRDFKKTLDAWNNELISAYKSQLNNDDSSITDNPSGYSFSYELNSEIIWMNDSIANWSGQTYLYMGGAHGIGNPINLIFNVHTGEELELDDFLNDGYQTTLKNLIIQDLCQQMNVSSYQDLVESGFWDENTEDVDYLDGAVTVMPDSFSIQYSPYQVACYAIGQPTATIAWSDLKQWRKSRVK